MKYFAAIVIGFVAQSVHASEPTFQYAKNVKPLPIKQDELLSVSLDADVYVATQDRFADLRLFDATSRPVPFLLHKARTTAAEKSRRAWPAKHLAAKPLDNGGLEITARLDKDDPKPTGLTIVSPLRDFEHRVRVEASGDGNKWEPLGKEAVIFDYSKHIDVRSVNVPFPETPQRHFRIVIDNVTTEQQSQLLALTRGLRGDKETDRTEKVIVDRRPFRIDRIDFWTDQESILATGDTKRAYPLTGFRTEADAKYRQTLVYVESQRQPLTSLELETPSRNFSRHASVEVERTNGLKKSWERIGDATVSRIDFKDIKRESLAITFPETRQAHYRIVIDDRDGPPLEVTAVKALGNVYTVVFLAGPDQRYHIHYGSADAAWPGYDTGPIEEVMRKFQPTSAELEAQATTAPPEADGIAWKKHFNNPLLLGTLIALMVLLLGWGLYRAVQRMDKMPPTT